MYYVVFSTSGPTNSTVTAGSNIVYSIGVVGFSLILLLLLLVLVLVLMAAICMCSCDEQPRYWTLKDKISEVLEGQWTYLNASTIISAHTESLTCIITLLI